MIIEHIVNGTHIKIYYIKDGEHIIYNTYDKDGRNIALSSYEQALKYERRYKLRKIGKI